MKKYEILYTNGKVEIVDQKTMKNLVYELESFERDDVSQIHEYDEKIQMKLVKQFGLKKKDYLLVMEN